MTGTDPARLSTREHQGFEGLLALREDWARLAGCTGHYFHCFDWFREFVKHDEQCAASFLCVAVSGADGRVVGIVPLEQRTERIRRIPFGIWAIVGSRSGDVMMLASGSDILCESPKLAGPVLRAVLRHLAGRRPMRSLLLAGRMTREAMGLDACLGMPGRAHYQRGAVDWIATDRDYAELHSALSRKFRGSLRNTANRAAAEGTVEFRRSESDSPDFAEAVADFKRVEASGWKGKVEKGGALATAPSGFQRGFVDAIFAPGSACGPFVQRLLLDGRCIAALLAVRGLRTVAVLKIGYDESFHRLGPGHLLLRDVLEACCLAPDIDKVDMVSHTSWVSCWAPEVQAHHWCYLPVRPLLASLPMTLLRLPSRRTP